MIDARRYDLKDLLGVGKTVGTREQKMAAANLRHTEFCQVQHSIGDLIVGGLKPRNGEVEHTPVIVLYRWNVLKQDEGGPKDFSGPHRAEVKDIPGISPASVVVQIRMPLAGRTRQKNVDRTNAPAQRCLSSGGRVPETTIDHVRDVVAHGIGPRKVPLEYFDCVWIEING